MKRGLILLAVMTTSLALQAQIVFEKGYIINNDGQRTECMIRNVDWKDCPKTFDYKIGDGETVQGTLSDISEFGVFNGATFKRFKGQIDRSPDLVERITVGREPQWSDETLFLRVLVDGKAMLYYFKDDIFERFFYSVNQSDIKQLVYKRYLTKGQVTVAGLETTGLGENESYKQQLFNDLTCADISRKSIEGMKYVKSDLTKLFSKYNSCQGATASTVKEEGTKKGVTQITIRPGLTVYSMKTTNSSNSALNRDFGTNVSYRIGLELENILPWNKGTWSLLFEPVYGSYSASSGTTNVKYNSLDFNAGVRRYFFLNGGGKLYLNAVVIYGFPISSAITYSAGSGLTMKSGVNFAFAAGYTANK
ncbi:MAG: hypothetical protein JNK10_14610, partial [Cyclobacteriaceae bacterium]|nr:hypothetical protein [Cyclobacteriaceae bacterium]